ncbi:MAG: exo-alpha-sialidase [Phycisphaerae bacterium]|jgi:sialidase-1|nr:exo-alpha-sialidase [Phycisphaerae bacterium]
MTNRSTGVFLGLLWLGLSVSIAAAEEGVDFRKDVFVRGADGYHTYRIPTMVVTSKGTVLLFCEGRKNGRRDMGNVDQIMKRSTDGGKTWSKQVILLDEGSGRVGNPCPIVERDGKTVHLLFTRHVGECLFYTKSVDDGKTWSRFETFSGTPGQKEYDKKSFLHKLGDPPVKLAVGPVHGIQTKKGRLIAPCYGGWMSGGKRHGGSFVIYSDDRGKTWNAGGVVPFVKDLRTGECTILERPDGSLMMNLRTSAPGLYGLGHRAVSISTDRGMTWSKPVLDKNLPSTGCQGSTIRLNEKEILFLNPAVHRKGGFSIRSRRNLTLRLSKDEGKSWTSSRVLNEKLAGYSDMAITTDGKILCVFENGKRDYCEKISIVQVDRAWLLAGKGSGKKPESGKAFTMSADKFGPVYSVDAGKVRSTADLREVPGVKIAWDLRGNEPIEWLANARDVNGDGKIDLIASAGTKDGNRVVRYHQDGRRVWTSEPINGPLGNESGMAIEDLDGDGRYEVVFNVLRQLWCLDADTGKAKWKADLPACRNNYQVSVVGHFLDRKRFAVICRVGREVTCFDPLGKKVWTYRIKHKNLYGHEMTHYDADGDGLDEAYISLNGKLLALGGDGKLRWSDTNCRNHSDFILCGDVDGDGDLEIVYDRDGCGLMNGPVVCADGRTGKLVRRWTYARAGKDHLQRAVLGDFAPSRPGLELAAVGKRREMGGLMLWSAAGGPVWRKDIPVGWVTWGDWDGNGKPEIMVTHGDGWQVWTGAGKRIYAIGGVRGVPFDVECAGGKRPDLDGDGKADVLLWTGRYMLIMEAP